ncbi:AurF N-oxygenase family protein [Nocardia pseudovaccinii]|uniref:AurF N-oxygenase family protein n=1 Tax=Nocardia pseudovaccinii TaxID=189540 RepID=UPI003D8B1F92
MVRPTSINTGVFDAEYQDTLKTLSNASVHRRFDPYLDIDWDSPEFAVEPDDPRWVLSAVEDPLGGTQWYRDLPLARQIEIGRWREANTLKVGLAFESMLVRGLMQYAIKLPNQTPEFRYCLHELTEECNHIQMFQELINRIGADVPGMRPLLRMLSPYVGVLGGYWHTVLFIGIVAGEDPNDRRQKALIREGRDRRLPPALVRTMEIHVAEEARHISFAHQFLRVQLAQKGPLGRAWIGLLFPLFMRWLAGQIMTPPRSFAKQFGIPKEVMREAFWHGPHARELMRSYFDDVRTLVEGLGLMNPFTRLVWKLLRIDGFAARYRGEPYRVARSVA